MVKPKNYDSPFDREELEQLERQSLLDEEQLQDTGFNDIENIYPPIGSYVSLPSSLWFRSALTPLSDNLEETEAYKRYKEIEGLE